MRSFVPVFLVCIVCWTIIPETVPYEIFRQNNIMSLLNKLTNSPKYSENSYGIGMEPPKRRKRASTFYTTEESVCPNHQEWKNLSQATTADGVTVEVIQGMFGWGYQWFYTVECDPRREGRPCRWIEESVFSKTSCKTKENLVPAIIKEFDADSFDWKMIRIPAQCDCVREQQVYL